jgi:hypothetical protein
MMHVRTLLSCQIHISLVALHFNLQCLPTIMWFVLYIMILLGCYAGYWLHTPKKPSPQVPQYGPYRPQFYVDPAIRMHMLA